MHHTVLDALKKCCDAAEAAVSGDREAVISVIEGLVISGMMMNFVGHSRPASGMEHYISHIIDMRALEFGTPSGLHGVQAGIGTLMTVDAYRKLMQLEPDEIAAKAAVEGFCKEDWYAFLRKKLGRGAEGMIAGEEREQKYSVEKHASRIETIVREWETIRQIVSELPNAEELRTFMRKIGHPVSGEELGLTHAEMVDAFLMAKDIRDKYVLGRLIWDLYVQPEKFSEFVK